MEHQGRTDVDLAGLRAFAQELRRELETGFQPGVDRAEHELQQGVQFGLAAPGGEVAAGREAFAWVLARAKENTARQLDGWRLLAETVERILANYHDGEDAVNQLLTAVEQRLSALEPIPDGMRTPPAGHQP